MIINNLRLIIRHLYKNRLYTILKVFGLALAITVGIAIFAWIRFETSYDSFHENADEIYRVVIMEDGNTGRASISPAVKTKILTSVMDKQQIVRLFKTDFMGNKTKVTANEKTFTNDDIYYADDNFFNVFSFPLIHGNPKDVLKKPHSIVITEKTANKYFGKKEPVGQSILFDNRDEFVVTGVLKNLPSNSHYHFDMLVSLKDHSWDIEKTSLGSGWVFQTYIKLNSSKSKHQVIENLAEFMTHMKSKYPEQPDYQLQLQPLKSIHLHSHLDGELEPNGDIRYIYLFITIGLLVLVIASINYINLTTVSLSTRAKEIGIRKVLGASQNQLMKQFVGESIIVCSIALLLSFFLLSLFEPIISKFAISTLYSNLFGMHTLAFSGILILLLGVITGWLPGLYFSKFNPASIFRSGFFSRSKDKHGNLRNSLVIIQFSISIVLIASSLLMYQQMKYIQNKKLGYNKDHLLILNISHEGLYQKTELFKNELTKHPNILNASAVSQLPNHIITTENVDARDEKTFSPSYMSIDNDFFKTMDIEILEGKENIQNIVFDPNQDRYTLKNRFVVNEQFVKELGVDNRDALEEQFSIRHGNMQKGPIIGVVKDFHFQSLHKPIAPLVLEFVPWDYQYLLIKCNGQNIRQTIGFIETQWKQLAGNIPFSFTFLDDHYNALYNAETQTGQLFLVFTIISIFIIILGMFGLASFSTERRTKEIGVRKVLGASEQLIFGMLLKGYAMQTILANLIAWPIAWYAMNKWLQNFAYRIDLTVWPFLLAGLTALTIAILTVSWISFRAATANPVESLKYE